MRPGKAPALSLLTCRFSLACWWHDCAVADPSMLRSIGNIKPIFSFQYPNCFKTLKTCNANETRAPDYTQILGIVFGMITLGFIGDKIGRAHPSAAAALVALRLHLCTRQGILLSFPGCHLQASRHICLLCISTLDAGPCLYQRMCRSSSPALH